MLCFRATFLATGMDAMGYRVPYSVWFYGRGVYRLTLWQSALKYFVEIGAHYRKSPHGSQTSPLLVTGGEVRNSLGIQVERLVFRGLRRGRAKAAEI